MEERDARARDGRSQRSSSSGAFPQVIHGPNGDHAHVVPIRTGYVRPVSDPATRLRVRWDRIVLVAGFTGLVGCGYGSLTYPGLIIPAIAFGFLALAGALLWEGDAS